MGIWQKIVSFFKKEEEYVHYDDFKRQNYEKEYFKGLEDVKKRP